MSMRMTDFLGYLTLFAILAAIWILFGENPEKHQGGRGEIYLADFVDQANKVAEIDLQKQGQALKLKQGATGWQLVVQSGTAGYPVPTAQVNGMLQALVDVERIDPKTMNKDRFSKLHLADKALIVTLKDAKSEVLRQFKVGKHRAVEGKSRSYAFQDSDTRAWMVGGMPNLPLDVADWIKNPVIDIPRADIKQMTLSDGTVIRQEGDKLMVAPLSDQGKADQIKAVEDYKLGMVLNGLAQFEAQNVIELANPLEAPLKTIQLVRTDGQTVTASIYEQLGKKWVKISGVEGLDPWAFLPTDASLKALLTTRDDITVAVKSAL